MPARLLREVWRLAPGLFAVGAKGHLVANVAVAVAEAVLLVGFSIPLWADRVDRFPPAEQSIRVRVVAEQFAWNVHYPGPDGVFGRTDPKLVDVQTNPLGLDRSDPAAKARRRREVFPQDCSRAYELGAKLALAAKER